MVTIGKFEARSEVTGEYQAMLYIGEEKCHMVPEGTILLELISETLLEIIERSLTLENRLRARKKEKENSPRLS